MSSGQDARGTNTNWFIFTHKEKSEGSKRHLKVFQELSLMIFVGPPSPGYSDSVIHFPC